MSDGMRQGSLFRIFHTSLDHKPSKKYATKSVPLRVLTKYSETCLEDSKDHLTQWLSIEGKLAGAYLIILGSIFGCYNLGE